MSPSSCKLLFAGDSITSGMPGASYFDLVAARLASSSLWPEVELINAGRGGDTVEALLHRIPPLLERHHPRWAILAIGHNDIWLPHLRGHDPLMDVILASRARLFHQSPSPNLEEFESAYRTMVGIIRDFVGGRLVICTCSVIGEDLSSPANRAMASANDLIRNLAEAQDLELAEVWEAFSRVLSRPSSSSSTAVIPPDGWQYIQDHLRSRFSTPGANHVPGLRLTFDGVHPNLRGSELWAQMVWQALSAAALRLGI